MKKENLIVVILIILVVLLGFLIPRFIPQKDYFTELYFTEPEGLPLMMQPGSAYNFSFAVVSHEKESKEVDYLINSEILKENGTVWLNPEESKIVKISLIPSEQTENDKLTVSSGNLSIYFYYTVEKLKSPA